MANDHPLEESVTAPAGGTAAAPSASGPITAVPAALGANVMVLLDDEVNAGLLRDSLQGMGYRNVNATEDPALARQSILRDRPDLLLVDATLPTESGIDMLAWIKSDSALKDTPVIVLSSSMSITQKLSALELGASDYLFKPVDARELALRMRNALAVSLRSAGERQADALTGLDNRQRFSTVLDWAITYSRRMGVVGAVLQIGVDRFAQVNEALGQAAGDRLLQEFARRLMECVRETDMVSGLEGAANKAERGLSLSRIGGDEFTVLLPVVQRAEETALVAMRIRASMTRPFNISGNDLIVTCCIGIAVFPNDGTTRDVILGNAGIAMSHAKQQGRDRHEFYGREMNNRSLARLALERDLRMGIERNEFSLVYQPKVGVKAGRLMGAESLLRWHHPERGLISPVEFIPVAEEMDLISPLGDWVLRTACHQISQWHSQGIAAPRISVNVSARQLQEPGFEKKVIRTLEEMQIKRDSIVLELTESALMKDPDHTVFILKALREAGIGISIDDFGTGYSSRAYLRRFPLDELKIDRSFLMESTEDSAAIATAIIALGHSLRLKVVAEGVEHEHQLEFLRARNCDEYQGFLYSKPVPAKAFEMLMRSGAQSRK